MMSGESGQLEAAEGMERGNRSELSRRWTLWELEEGDSRGQGVRKDRETSRLLMGPLPETLNTRGRSGATAEFNLGHIRPRIGERS